MQSRLRGTGSATLLRRLEVTRLDYGPGRAGLKLALLRALERRRMSSAQGVLRLHEHLCFMRAYPDNRAVLAQVRRMLAGFVRRADLRRHRSTLVDSGIAGADIRYPFFWATARRLAQRWPDRLAIDWDEMAETAKLADALLLLVSPIEATWLRQCEPDLPRALSRLSGARMADGAFVVYRVAAMPGDDFTREAFFDRLELPLLLPAGKNTPARTCAEHAAAPIVFRRQPPSRERPDLIAALARPPRAVQSVSARAGRALIELARDAMATRARDLDAFAYGNERDVRIVDDGDGLQWAVIGMIPERRPVLKATYGLLALRNGVPIGYLDAHVLCRCVDLSYNIFDTFRGAEAAFVFGRLLAAFRQLFGATSFTLEPYQLGHDNEEALGSGAWWFYYRLGFRPRNRAIRTLARRELARMRARRTHRSSASTLAALAGDYLYFETRGARALDWRRFDALGENVAARAPLATAISADSAAQRLGVPAPRGAALRMAWERWAPIVALLPGLTRWSRAERHALAAVIAAKAGRRDGEFLERFDAHPRLGPALRWLTNS